MVSIFLVDENEADRKALHSLTKLKLRACKRRSRNKCPIFCSCRRQTADLHALASVATTVIIRTMLNEKGEEPMNVREYLERNGADFEMLEHEPTYSAQKLAASVHVSGRDVAKAVLLWTQDDHVLAVLPAADSVDLERVQELLNEEIVELATEKECGERFNDCELGAVPPFGSQYGIKTLLDESLLLEDEIVFEGNTHHQAFKMRRKDYVELENPIIDDISYHYY
jgi:Ala-tRNA(Pro) deacylase